MASIQDLINSNLLLSGTQLVWKRRNDENVRRAIVLSDGKLETDDGEIHKSPSGAARHIGKKPVDGWLVWKIQETGQSLDSLRQAFTERKLN